MVLDYEQPTAFVRCIPPDELGGEPLAQDERGVWSTSAGMTKHARLTSGPLPRKAAT
jgi:hypothetical protein